jgi:hypothetical protein
MGLNRSVVLFYLQDAQGWARCVSVSYQRH